MGTKRAAAGDDDAVVRAMEVDLLRVLLPLHNRANMALVVKEVDPSQDSSAPFNR